MRLEEKKSFSLVLTKGLALHHYFRTFKVRSSPLAVWLG